MGLVTGLRVMLLNVDVGAGHRRAGEALCQALGGLRPGSTFRTVEALEHLGPGAGKLARDIYLGMQQELPGLWGAIYEQRGLFQLLRPLGELADDLRVELGLLPEALRFNPQLLVATHPLACGLGAGLRRSREIDAPLVAVLTDLDGHPAWVAEGIDLYLAPTAAAAADLRARGAARGAVVETGIPLREAFSGERDRLALREPLGLERGRLTLLLLGGGLGLGPIIETARALCALQGPVQVVLIAGSNRELEEQARALARDAALPVTVTGHVENIADYMATADLVLSKPGGLTCAELLALGRPLVALRPLAGQEEANCAVLVREGAAVRADDARAAHLAVEELLRRPADLQRMEQAAARLGRPGAAKAAAREIIARLAS